jgi:hypothetical protein
VNAGFESRYRRSCGAQELRKHRRYVAGHTGLGRRLRRSWRVRDVAENTGVEKWWEAGFEGCCREDGGADSRKVTITTAFLLS